MPDQDVFGFSKRDANQIIELLGQGPEPKNHYQSPPNTYQRYFIFELLNNNWGSFITPVTGLIVYYTEAKIYHLNGVLVLDRYALWDPLGTFNELGLGDRGICAPASPDYFLALQAPCGG
jgi:hypothetical protein